MIRAILIGWAVSMVLVQVCRKRRARAQEERLAILHKGDGGRNAGHGIWPGGMPWCHLCREARAPALITEITKDQARRGKPIDLGMFE